MAKFTITIPADKLSVIVDGIAYGGGYTDTIQNPDYNPEEEGSEEEIANPQTKVSFAKGRVKDILKSVVKSYYVRESKQDAAEATIAEVEADVENITVT